MPLKCVLWPEVPPIKIPECGFFFWDTQEERTVKYGDKV